MERWGLGRIAARPHAPGQQRPAPGTHEVKQANGRVGYMYVPEHARNPAVVLVMLHGASQFAARALEFTKPFADAVGGVLYVPQSGGRTWDIIESGLGPDVASISSALDYLFDRFELDAGLLTVAGFSDGASYALTLGVANGDLFPNVIAWSPGFIAAPVEHGRPRVFISHGTEDRVLPIDRCSRRLVPGLRSAGYDVDYREFSGGHVLPDDIRQAAVEWLVGGRP